MINGDNKNNTKIIYSTTNKNNNKKRNLKEGNRGKFTSVKKKGNLEDNKNNNSKRKFKKSKKKGKQKTKILAEPQQPLTNN